MRSTKKRLMRRLLPYIREQHRPPVIVKHLRRSQPCSDMPVWWVLFVVPRGRKASRGLGGCGRKRRNVCLKLRPQ